MSNKVSYAKLNLKVNNTVKTFKFMDNEVEVLNYLPIEDKYDLIMIALQKSEEDGIYNELKLDMYFHLYLVFMYTNLSFTDKQRLDEEKIYDHLKSSGILDQVLENIPSNEYNTLLTFEEELVKTYTEYNCSIVSLVQSLIHDLPAQAEAANQIVENFDKNKFKEVIEFAKEANGGRDIK